MIESRKVLVVDDSQVARMLISGYIAECRPNWIIKTAENGQMAFSICQNESFDIFTIDYNMPGIDGLSLAVQLRSLYPDSVFVILTSNIQQKIQKKIAEAKISFMAKPINGQSIRSLLASLNL